MKYLLVLSFMLLGSQTFACDAVTCDSVVPAPTHFSQCDINAISRLGTDASEAESTRNCKVGLIKEKDPVFSDCMGDDNSADNQMRCLMDFVKRHHFDEKGPSLEDALG